MCVGARSFNQLRLDGKLAMAIWASAAPIPLDDPKAARSRLKGRNRLPREPARENSGIALRAKQLDAISDISNPAKHLEYKKAIDDARQLTAKIRNYGYCAPTQKKLPLRGEGNAAVLPRPRSMRRCFNIARQLRRASLSDSSINIGQMEPRKHGEAYSRLAFAIRAPYVRPRPSPGQPHYGGDLGISEGRRFGELLLQR
jgi:hypothetical protein